MHISFEGPPFTFIHLESQGQCLPSELLGERTGSVGQQDSQPEAMGGPPCLCSKEGPSVSPAPQSQKYPKWVSHLSP